MDLYRQYNHPYKSILFILSNSVSDFRLTLAAKWLSEWGYNVEVTTSVPAWLSTYHDVIVVERPCLELLPILDLWIKAGKTVIIDMDDDFMAIPKTNPAYPIIGQGRPGYMSGLETTIKKATVLTVTTPEVAIRYGRDAVIIPNCWDETNKLWQSRLQRNTVNIGWVGTQTHWEDFQLVKDALMQVLSERPSTKVVIGLDDKIYNLFESLPENRKLYIPGMPYQIYPAFYGYTDIVLAPLLDNHFNRAKSEIKLIEAGAASRAWVASPMPFYYDWYYGGVFASTPENWYSQIIGLVDNPPDMLNQGEVGHAKALTRTSEIIAREWQIMVDRL